MENINKNKNILLILLVLLSVFIIISYVNYKKHVGIPKSVISDITYDFETKEIPCSNDGKKSMELSMFLKM